MAIQKEAFINQYLEELQENVEQLDGSVINLKKDPGNDEELNRILRILHTIKGSSRMLKFSIIEKLAHGLESVFKGIKEQRYQISDGITRLSFLTSDYLREVAHRIRRTRSDDVDVDAIVDTLQKASSSEPFSLPEHPRQSRRQKAGAVTTASGSDSACADADDASIFQEFQTIRIRVDHINEIIKRMNNLIISQFQLKKQNDLISQLEKKIDCFEPLDCNGENRDNRRAEFDKFEKGLLKDVQMIRKTLQEQLETIERETFGLQEMIIGLRMFPLQMILGSLPKMVEELSLSLNKKIRFTLSGGDLKLEKIILETINDPIIHIIRNAVDHGIESPAARAAAGKDDTATISVSCRSESGAVLVVIQDDGCGILFDRVRERAREMFPTMKEEIDGMTETELAAYLFMPGFSTSATVSDLSGRGVGLDIVKHNIEKIKGKITLSSVAGKGTTFSMNLPLSLATIGGYFITAASGKFFIPANYVREILLIQRKDVIQVLNKKAFMLREELIHLYPLSLLLDIKVSASDEKIHVLLVESLGTVIGIAVDSIIEYASLIYKPLPQNLLKHRFVQGIVFDENYDIVTILNVPALIDLCKSMNDIEMKKRYARSQRRSKHILVIDDSANSREIQKSILETARFTVSTAQDGIDGLAKMRQEDFHLIITDISMPRMDGFTFIENVRREKKYHGIPIIVVSNVEDAESKQRAHDLGANRYIVKSDFDRNNLLENVQNLII